MLLSEPMPSRAAGVLPDRAVEDAVAEARLGDRAEPGDRAGRGEPARSRPRSSASGGSATSARSGAWWSSSHSTGRAAGGGHDLLDLGDLLGEVHVQRAARAAAPAQSASASGLTARSECGATPSRRRAAGRGAPPRRRRAGGGSRRGRCRSAAGRGPSGRRSSAAELVEHRQERQADAGAAAAAAMRSRHLGDVVVGRAAGPVVEVVELDDGGVARLQHLHLHEAAIASTSSGVRWSRKRYMICRQVQKVSRGCGPRASDSPAMARWKAWRGGSPAPAAGARPAGPRAAAPGATAAIRPSAADLDPHVSRPALGQQRPLRPEHRHRHLPAAPAPAWAK